MVSASKVVLITGCRSGFGRVFAERLDREGHLVYAGFRDLADAEPLADAWRGTRIVPVQLDVTREADRKAAVARVLAEQGRIDVLINNAGIALGGFLEDIDEDELRQVFETNLFGLWALTVAVLPGMRARGAGLILNISSMSGRMAAPGLGVYASSKFALEGMSEAWRHELRPFGVHVVLLEPGAFKTDIFSRNRRIGRRAGRPDSPYKSWFDWMNRRFEEVTDRISRDPAELAERVVRIVGEARPTLREPVGLESYVRLILKTALPWSVFEVILGRVLGVQSMRGRGA